MLFYFLPRSRAELATTDTDEMLCIIAPIAGDINPSAPRTTAVRLSVKEKIMFVVIVAITVLDKSVRFAILRRSPSMIEI